MPAAIICHLRAEQPDPRWPVALGRALHGAFLRLVAEHDPHLATALHDWPRPAPVTLAPLMASADGRLVVRLGLLDDALLPLLAPALVEFSGERLRLGPVTCHFTRCLTDPAIEPLAGWTTIDQLRDTPPAAAWTFQFLTPTAFKTNQVYLPLPLPRSMWGSWLRRWNDLTPEDRWLDPVFLDDHDRHLQIVDLALSAGVCHLTGQRLDGFTGRVTIRALKRPPREWLRVVSILAAYSFYAGTGVQTMTGMGVTTCLSEPC